MTKKIRGVTFEENLNNGMGLEFYNLSHRFGYQSPNWLYFEDVKIADPLLFLASNASNFYTEHILYADGGYTAG